MSALVQAALGRAGLADVLEARLAGDLAQVRARAEELLAADLLVLGALANRIRVAEVGDEVRLYPAAPADGVVALRAPGLELLRAVALARILGPPRAAVRVDFGATGLEIAQVALGFGADELAGAPQTKRGLPIVDGDVTDRGKRSARVPLAVAKQRELEALVRRAGRVPVLGIVPARREGEAHP